MVYRHKTHCLIGEAYDEVSGKISVARLAGPVTWAKLTIFCCSGAPPA